MSVNLSNFGVNLSLHTLCESYMIQRLGNPYPDTLILCLDTGASFDLTLFRSSFIDFKDVTNVNQVIDIDTTLYKMVDTNGKEILLLCILYHLNETEV